MTHDTATITARLTSWQSFYSADLWMGKLAELPLTEALDAALAGPPAWVTSDTTPESAPGERQKGEWDIEPLLLAAWGSGDAALIELADHCEDLGTAYLMDKRQH